MRPLRPIREQFRPVAAELPDRWAFRAFPCPGRSLCTTHVLARCFVESRPMVCLGSHPGADGIALSIVVHRNPPWKNRTLRFLQKPLDITGGLRRLAQGIRMAP